jgi:hypothetical protein
MLAITTSETTSYCTFCYSAAAVAAATAAAAAASGGSGLGSSFGISSEGTTMYTTATALSRAFGIVIRQIADLMVMYQVIPSTIYIQITSKKSFNCQENNCEILSQTFI